jgi:hypothetical protein
MRKKLRSKASVAVQLNAAQVRLCNSASDAEIQGLVGAYGFTPQKLAEGQAAYNTARTKVNEAVALAGARRQCSEYADKAATVARTTYQGLARVARAVFVRQPGVLQRMGLTGPMPRALPAFSKAAFTLFNTTNYTEAMRTKLAAHGYTDSKLSTERSKLEDFDLALRQAKTAKGAAQQATKDQEQALQALREWVAMYGKVARVALRERPQLLEKIGILSRSSKTPAQREAPLKARATRARRKSEALALKAA